MKPNANAREINILLRLEGTFAAVAGLYLYTNIGASWWLFAALILTPDISFLGYIKDTKFGARCYNGVHTYIAPAILWGGLTALNITVARELALIWMIHIGLDRMLGYGLKYADAFKHTHLSRAS